MEKNKVYILFFCVIDEFEVDGVIGVSDGIIYKISQGVFEEVKVQNVFESLIEKSQFVIWYVEIQWVQNLFGKMVKEDLVSFGDNLV